MHCILVHLFRGKAVPQVSILNSEVWNRKFRNLGFEIPKLWIPKTAQDCCKKVNGTLDWGIPKILIASWIPKIEQFQKPLLPNKCLLIGSHSHLCCVICMLIAPVSVKACEIPLQSQSPTFQCSTEYSFHNGSQKTQSWLFPSICKDRFTAVLSACLFSAPCFAPFKWPHHFKWPCVRDWYYIISSETNQVLSWSRGAQFFKLWGVLDSASNVPLYTVEKKHKDFHQMHHQ